MVVGGTQDSVTLPIAIWFTAMVNAPSEACAAPSDTEIRTLLNWPTSPAPGVPVRRPVAELNVAQAGRFWMLNVKASPSGSEALGWKLYASPARSDVWGVPVIVGARFVDPGGGGVPPDESSGLVMLDLLSKHALHTNATAQTTASFRADDNALISDRPSAPCQNLARTLGEREGRVRHVLYLNGDKVLTLSATPLALVLANR